MPAFYAILKSDFPKWLKLVRNTHRQGNNARLMFLPSDCTGCLLINNGTPQPLLTVGFLNGSCFPLQLHLTPAFPGLSVFILQAEVWTSLALG